MRACVRPWSKRAGLTALLALMAASPVWAHGLGAECRLRGGQVEVTAYYDDDTPAAGARVRLLDERKQEVVAGRTDAQGRWALPAPAAGKYEVVVDAGAGHRTTRTLTVPAGAAASTDAERSDPDAPVISDGPTRAESTRFPWGNLGLGLGLIAGGALVVYALARRKIPRRDISSPTPA